jgi:aldehyde dehydrogenase (NAD+)
MSAQPVIKDDTAAVKSAILKTQKAFNSGKTIPIGFRLAQLSNLKKGIIAMEKDLTDAV